MHEVNGKEKDELASLIAEHAAPLVRGMMGHGGIRFKNRYSVFEQIYSYIEITRPFLLLMAPPIAGAGAILANGKMPNLLLVILGALAAVSATAGIHTFNDWRDRARDQEAWPDRPIPTSRIPPSAALIYALLLMLGALVIVWFSFNPLATAVLAVGIVFGIIYTLFLRDAVGYLSLPFIIAVFPLGGWAAFSPETLFKNPVPWILGLTAVIWQCAHIMVHSPSHPIETNDGRLRTEKKAFFFYPSPSSAAWMGLYFTLALLLISVGLFFLVGLGWFYLAIAMPMGAVALLSTIVLVMEPTNKEKSMGAFNIASIYLIFIFGAIVIDLFFRKSLEDYVLGTGNLLGALSRFLSYRLEGITAFLYAVGTICSVGVTLFAVFSLSRLLLRTMRR
jgi:heme O synthase-like polyprenyltransferase